MTSLSALNSIRIIPRDSEFLDRKLGSRGEIFFDQASSTLRLYDGITTGGIPLLRADLSNAEVGIGAVLGDNPPTGTTVQAGSIWFNTSNGRLYIYYNDGNSTQWVQPTTPSYGSGSGGATTINELSDVTITSPSAGQILKYNGTVWINETNGNASINSFATVAVSGQTSVIADSASDTLTLVAGPGIELTTNAGTDTITITNTGDGGGGSGVSSGTATRLAYYSSTGSVVQDTGANLTWSGTTLAITGTITASGAVSYVRAYFDTLAELTAVSAATWHGMVAHVHETGRMYFAHAGAWIPLANFSDLNYFSTIAIAGQSNVVADSATDTLTLVGAGGVTITTNATTDTITITGSGAGGTLDALSDVIISSPSTNQVLKYNGTNWVNGTDSTAGGSASDSFATIAVAGQSDIVADSSTDTLFLAAGTGISITTDAGTDTITISNSAAAGATTFAALTDNAGLTADRFYLPAITQLAVTANGSSAYRFDQYSTADNPTIYAISGTTIAFDLSVGLASHPFLIRYAGANYSTGLVHVTTGGIVSTGAAAQGKTSGTLYWKIPAGISGTYGYLCSNHGSMAGIITIKDISAI